MRRIAAALFVAAVTPLGGQQPVFKSGVELVTVPITVTNAARDQLITAGLEAGDFQISEDGVPQKVTLFTKERRRVSVCFVVDASGSMDKHQRLDRGIRALQHTARGLDDGDEMAIVRFAGVANTILHWTSPPEIGRLSWRLDPGAGTIANSSIMDGVKVALAEIERAGNPRRVIVVISDGYENNSVTPLSRLAKTRQQSEATIYGFGVGGPSERGPSGGILTNILPAMVGETGGVYWEMSTSAEAEFAAMSLVTELKYQMTLGYESTKPFDGKYRRIKVETSVKGLAVRHRGGYLAVPSTNP
jgi:Ca-activated chloride channel family protein